MRSAAEPNGMADEEASALSRQEKRVTRGDGKLRNEI
jgi:hypothetical protein